uniref:Uncharacterized protein n=1 Tax=Rhizophora mucronata TaxID=61149 RepID=A0A2P2KZU0_RHIMU
MAEHLTGLCQLLFEERLSPSDFFRRLRSDSSLNLGLQRLYLILKRGVSVVQEDDHNHDRSSRLGFQLWTDTQIQSVVSLGLAIASASRSLSVEQAQPIVVAVVHQLLEFAICYLEKSDLSNNDRGTQSDMVLLMEFALACGVDQISEPLHPCSANSLVELLTIIPGDYCGFELDKQIKCGLQGFSCLREKKPTDQLLVTLASECRQPESQSSAFCGHTKGLNYLTFFVAALGYCPFGMHSTPDVILQGID